MIPNSGFATDCVTIEEELDVIKYVTLAIGTLLSPDNNTAWVRLC